jgi:hypothetical protein
MCMADIFLRITQYIGDTHNARTLVPMNTRTQNLPLGAFSKTVPVLPTTESTNAVKSWEIRSHGELNPEPEVLPGLL